MFGAGPDSDFDVARNATIAQKGRQVAPQFVAGGAQNGMVMYPPVLAIFLGNRDFGGRRIGRAFCIDELAETGSEDHGEILAGGRRGIASKAARFEGGQAMKALSAVSPAVGVFWSG